MPSGGVDGCEAAHPPLLHGALVEGRVMVVMAEQGIDDKKAQVHLCQEDVRVEVAGKTRRTPTVSCRCSGEGTRLLAMGRRCT